MPTLLAGEQEVDVWLASEEAVSEDLQPRLCELLSGPERAQMSRFYFAADRKRYIVTRALVRTVLSRYAAVSPADWRFTANRYGRPRIAAAHRTAAGLVFNISHTKGLIALAVARGRELGIDVENVASRTVILDIAEHFFSPTEAAELARIPYCQRQGRFFEYWTFKESYIKARGMGLSIPIHRFSFHYPHGRAVSLTIEPDLHDDPRRWCFWQFRPAPEHLLALCAERRHGVAPRFRFRRIVPTLEEEVLTLPVQRTSELSYTGEGYDHVRCH